MIPISTIPWAILWSHSRFSAPISGAWKVHMTGTDLPQGGEEISVFVTSRSTDAVYLPQVAR